MNSTDDIRVPTSPDERFAYVLQRYDRAIAYYWRASGRNKKVYTIARYLIIVIGAAVTLFSTLAASGQFAEQGKWKFLTPVLAAILTVTSTLLQTFQWEAAWREMVLTAEQLEKERDRIRVLEPAKLDATAELAQLNSLVIEESQGFFDRVLGRSGPPQGRIQK